MRKQIFPAAFFGFLLFLVPVVSAITIDVTDGESNGIGENNISTEFGMVTGQINLKLGDFNWVPDEIWLIPQDMDPDVFSKGLTQQEVIEIPKNVTFSTCRTAIYYNETLGYGFKIYNTGSTTQIFSDGTFCGLAYNGTYFVFAKY